MQLKGFYLCHNRRGFCCFGLQLPAALWPKKFHTHEIYWATIWKAFPHIFSMKAFLKYKLSHKRLFGFMKHAVLEKKKKKKKAQSQTTTKIGLLMVLQCFVYFPCSSFQSSQIFKNFHFNTISFK